MPATTAILSTTSQGSLSFTIAGREGYVVASRMRWRSLMRVMQAVPLSNFKLFPFKECSSFDKCPTALQSRKVLRKILPDGSF